jgi:vacuolar-type H+-ATPase subunit E/Vma4
MGVETMIEAIEAEAEAEAERLLADADSRAFAIEAGARAAREARVAAACERLEPGLRAEAARTVNTARLRLLERRAELAAARTEAAFDAAAARLEAIAAGGDRGRWSAALRALANETLPLVGGGAIVTCRPADAVELAGLSAGSFTVEVSDGLSPGIRARSADGTVEVDATVATRLARARTQLAEPVAARLGLEV